MIAPGVAHEHRISAELEHVAPEPEHLLDQPPEHRGHARVVFELEDVVAGQELFPGVLDEGRRIHQRRAQVVVERQADHAFRGGDHARHAVVGHLADRTEAPREQPPVEPVSDPAIVRFVVLQAAQLLDRIERAAAMGTRGKEAEDIVEELLGSLEAGTLRSAEKGSDGEWRAVPWVKRGILLGFQAGTLTDINGNNEITLSAEDDTYAVYNLDTISWMLPGTLYQVTGCVMAAESIDP